MDLSALNTTLPQGLAEAERDMGDKFRAAALSITTLYKSSLACNKQAYQVGYSAALSDVLSKLQSDIAAGEDAASTLARLMDWAEAREAAMAAFAAEDDELPTSSRTQGMSARVPARPASAPVPEARPRGFGKEREAPGPSRLRPDSMDDEPTASVSTSGPTPAPTPRRDARPPVPVATPVLAPAVVLEDREASASMASSPLASPSVRPVAARTPRGGSSARPVPTSTFNFSIPTSILPPHPPAAVQATPVGSKRPIVAVDTEMADGTPGTPSRSSRKRRNMHGPEAEEKEKERANRRHHRRGGGLA